MTCCSCSTETFSLPLLLLISLITFQRILISSSLVFNCSYISPLCYPLDCSPPLLTSACKKSFWRRPELIWGEPPLKLKWLSPPYYCRSPPLSVRFSCPSLSCYLRERISLCIYWYISAHSWRSFSYSSTFLSYLYTARLFSTSDSSSLLAISLFNFSISNSYCFTTLYNSSLWFSLS
jgi:hypothetical protein